ncbi:hypothetical protein BAZO_21003 [Schinkia azotoformans LMG 9581]|uniref:Uncharacterized protein n=1 Tax=Schinkia azotoformans LMG 9581 TaxID=1131731 RepID=K6D345_SCHAZ|nr:hypothetical protein BAZO_21003 [Schinkia azotoformans LMG 9581]
MSAKKKNTAMPKAKPALPVRKKEKCGHAKGKTDTPCPQKRKMRPRQGQTSHSLSAPQCWKASFDPPAMPTAQ